MITSHTFLNAVFLTVSFVIGNALLGFNDASKESEVVRKLSSLEFGEVSVVDYIRNRRQEKLYVDAAATVTVGLGFLSFYF
mmetsp:Transcript_60798/g.71153  ORF Transcript_60798/g.71153 Transcript_60798/m.71153 type:complete len:81 (-) Transcript_60798:75-317(-)